jgi:HK97 family phage prohead protease/HK97 family phage major capsid protein
MPMTPHKDESQSDFMSRCMSETFVKPRTQEQAVAICMGYWRDEKGGEKPDKSVQGYQELPRVHEVDRIIKLWCKILTTKQGVPDPDDDEDHGSFMDRCIDEMTDQGMDDDEAEEACQMQWEDYDERRVKSRNVVQKTHAADVHGREFVLSDESVDRMGDIILSSGWQLESFNANPICLFNHSPMHPIGSWKGLRVEKGMLRGKLELAPEGTSPRIDEIRKLVDAGILRAVSVGFRPTEMKDRTDKGIIVGFIYTKSELVETSLVSVPANPNALAVAKSLNVSPATLDLVFAGHGKQGGTTVRRGFTGGHAKTSEVNGKDRAMSLGQRIADLQTYVGGKKEELDALMARMDDSNVKDDDLELGKALNADIRSGEDRLALYIEAEKNLGKSADNGKGNGHLSRSRALTTTTALTQKDDVTAPYLIPNRKKELDPLEYIVRAGTVAIAAKNWNRTAEEARLKIYGEDEGTKAVSDLVLRTATAPAMTTVTGWAAELAQQVYAEMMPLLMPKSLFARLSAKGLSLSFGRAGKILIPTRSRTPTIAGSFVGEGQAIPVRQGAFTSQTLTPKKMAVITTWTREMDEHSIPAIEGVLREAVQIDTGVAIDSVLIDSNAATVIRPPGLLNGVSATTATAGGGVAAVVGDIKGLVGALVSSTYGNLRAPTWLMNPGDMLSASLVTAANTGIFPFKDEVGRGTLNNIPIIDSGTIPSKTVILIDAADFVSVGGDGPRFELSDQATLHMEDSAPQDLVSGSPGTVASPQRSLFQTDSIALRLILPLNWVQRRAGTVAWTQNVTW